MIEELNGGLGAVVVGARVVVVVAGVIVVVDGVVVEVPDVVVVVAVVVVVTSEVVDSIREVVEAAVVVVVVPIASSDPSSRAASTANTPTPRAMGRATAARANRLKRSARCSLFPKCQALGDEVDGPVELV